MTSPAREGDAHVFGQVPVDRLNADQVAAEFDLRIRCSLSGVTQDVSSAYETRYRPNANPVLSSVTIGGAAIGDTLRVALGSRRRPPGGNDGDLAHDPRNDWTASEPGDGTLFVVLRDTRGGVTWKAIAIHVE